MPLQLIYNTLSQEHVRIYFKLKANMLKMSSKIIYDANNGDIYGKINILQVGAYKLALFRLGMISF